MKYRLEYSNKKVLFKNFKDKWEVATFVHNEGDHLISCKRID